MTIPSPSSSASFHVPRRVKGRKRERRGVYKSPKNGNFRERGKRPLPVTRTYYRQAERCAVCLTSGPAASRLSIPAKTRASARARVQAGRERVVAAAAAARPPPPTLYRFVDETTVIRHCVWPHPRPPPRFMALLRHPPRGPIISARPQRDLLPIPIASLDCNYTVTVCMACQNFPRSINGFNGISSQRLIASVWFRSLIFFSFFLVINYSLKNFYSSYISIERCID